MAAWLDTVLPLYATEGHYGYLQRRTEFVPHIVFLYKASKHFTAIN